jgi:LysM repeat protein
MKFWLAVALVLLAAGAAGAQAPLVHTVRPGETLASIAEAYYGDPRRESVLVTENGLMSGGGSAIVVGLRLVVPSVSYHRVQEGETWAELATRYYGDPSRAFVLIDVNAGKAGAQPDVGAELLIPYPLRHVVDQTEALRKIAKMYYKDQGDLTTIRRFNEIGSRVVRGQIVLVPLADLVLTAAGKQLAQQQSEDPPRGGDIREKQVLIDAQLPKLRELVRGGDYAGAVGLANRLIGSGDLSASQIVSIHRELATALCALGRDELAKDAFATMLEEQPDAELDGVRTSPKVLRVFEQAQKEHTRPGQRGEKKGRRSQRNAKRGGGEPTTGGR